MKALAAMRRATSALLHRHLPALGRVYRHLADRRWQARPAVVDGMPLYVPRSALHGEAALRAALMAEMRHADAYVDVGANAGLYACLVAATGKPVVAVEPQRANLAVLARNIALNKLGDAIEVVPVGLSERPGAATLYGMGDVASFDAAWNATGASYRETATLSTLDLVLADRFAGARLLIKIDVEGHEWPVLRGATATLARAPRPVWLVEIFKTRPLTGEPNDAFDATVAMFEACGYRSERIDESNFVFRAADQSDP